MSNPVLYGVQMIDMIFKLTKNEDHENAEYFADVKGLVYAVNYYLRDITSYTEEQMDKLIDDNTSIYDKYPTIILYDKEFKLVLSTHKLIDSFGL